MARAIPAKVGRDNSWWLKIIKLFDKLRFLLYNYSHLHFIMKSLFKVTFTSAALLMIAAASVFAQNSTFSDPNVEYSFEIPEAKWKVTSKPSATSPNVELVYGDRTDGHFEVRRITVEKNAIMSDVIKDEEVKLQFLPGYVAGRDEVFRGRLTGTVFNFEFVRSGRPMSGRFYFLRSGENVVYILRFTGFTDKLRSIRNQTDAIARTFSIRRS